MPSRQRLVSFVWLALALAGAAAWAQSRSIPDLKLFFQAAGTDERAARDALGQIAAAWDEAYAAMLLDLARLVRQPARGVPPETPVGFDPLRPDDEITPGVISRPEMTPGEVRPEWNEPALAPPGARQRLLTFLERQTGKRFGRDLNAWRQWQWSLDYRPHPAYVDFKRALYGMLDKEMAEFFPAGMAALIRLDEIEWGGVKVNGIPPLDHPKTLAAHEARYLKDTHIVFGVAINGEARAYPKRILAWHELARDRVGGVEIALVYCTLCGTAIPYEAEAGGARYTFGTSGLLYRSNKLMFDEETYSLWSSIEGRPVTGPLVGRNISLRVHPIVTTTWGEWRAEHPESTVLALDTGHKRDYSEGAAYREYFGTDDLMFSVPRIDRRLKNKAEVLVMRVGKRRQPVAIAADLLRRNRLYQAPVGDVDVVVITSTRGANRAFSAEGVTFMRLTPDGRVEDDQGRFWNVTETALVADGHDQRPRPRLAAQRAFWFGWYAQFPDTLLVK